MKLPEVEHFFSFVLLHLQVLLSTDISSLIFGRVVINKVGDLKKSRQNFSRGREREEGHRMGDQYEVGQWNEN
jgi:hypothetical protein